MCTSNSKQKTPNPEQRWHLWTYPTVVPRWSENLCAPEINRRRIFPCATFLSGAEIRAKEGKWLEGSLRRELAQRAPKVHEFWQRPVSQLAEAELQAERTSLRRSLFPAAPAMASANGSTASPRPESCTAGRDN